MRKRIGIQHGCGALVIRMACSPDGPATTDSDAGTSSSDGGGFPSACPAPVGELLGNHDFDGSDDSFATIPTNSRFPTGFSFSGWVRFDSWTGDYNRVFDFGSTTNHSIRLHRNLDETLRFAFNELGPGDVSDFPNYWVVGEYAYVTATADANGQRTVYKNGTVFGTATGTRPADTTWSETEPLNYYVARSNWYDSEPGSDVTTQDLYFFDTVIDESCVAALMAMSPP